MRLSVVFLVVAALHAQDAGPQQPPPANTGTVIRTETKQVLVDAVVTDKKGNYVRDLEQKSFKVAEDGKAQTIKSFSYEADPASPAGQREAVPGDVLRQLDHGLRRPEAGAGRSRQVHRLQREAEPADGHREFHGQLAGRAEFHGRRGAVETGGGGGEVRDGESQRGRTELSAARVWAGAAAWPVSRSAPC